MGYTIDVDYNNPNIYMQNSSSKSIGIFIVAALIILGIFLMTRSFSNVDTRQNDSSVSEQNNTETTTSNDFSDESLSNDAMAIEAELGILSTESAVIETAE